MRDRAFSLYRAAQWAVLLGTMSAPYAAPGQDDPRVVISGPVTIASRVDGDVNWVIVTSDGKYPAKDRQKVLAGARMMQRLLAKVCARQCKPGKMPAPTLSADGELRVEMAVVGLAGELTKEDTINLVMGRPLGPRKVAAKPVEVAPASAPAEVQQ